MAAKVHPMCRGAAVPEYDSDPFRALVDTSRAKRGAWLAAAASLEGMNLLCRVHREDNVRFLIDDLRGSFDARDSSAVDCYLSVCSVVVIPPCALCNRFTDRRR